MPATVPTLVLPGARHGAQFCAKSLTLVLQFGARCPLEHRTSSWKPTLRGCVRKVKTGEEGRERQHQQSQDPIWQTGGLAHSSQLNRVEISVSWFQTYLNWQFIGFIAWRGLIKGFSCHHQEGSSYLKLVSARQMVKSGPVVTSIRHRVSIGLFWSMGADKQSL